MKRQSESGSILSAAQKKDLDKRSEAYERGEGKFFSWEEAKTRAREKYRSRAKK